MQPAWLQNNDSCRPHRLSDDPYPHHLHRCWTYHADGSSRLQVSHALPLKWNHMTSHQSWNALRWNPHSQLPRASRLSSDNWNPSVHEDSCASAPHPQDWYTAWTSRNHHAVWTAAGDESLPDCTNAHRHRFSSCDVPYCQAWHPSQVQADHMLQNVRCWHHFQYLWL